MAKLKEDINLTPTTSFFRKLTNFNQTSGKIKYYKNCKL